MFKPPDSDTLTGHILQVSRRDRWQVHHRLQELKIPCWCPADGSLRVEINNSIEAVLVRSTVLQFIASRAELVDWLQRCWQV
ncbi:MULTISPECIES: Asr1405/Asl0597 family protein [Aerosakkonema]|uniref:Asr1405/Asl0597 family protein n=1 Tax=Aerosakkonema TaxID=1246629 RepID=UPI0035BA3A43